MVSTYLKKYRLDHNLTQKEMADLIGTSQSYYSRLESGKNKPGIGMMKKISEITDIPASELRNNDYQ